MPELSLSEENVLSATVKSEFGVSLVYVTFSSTYIKERNWEKFSFAIMHHNNHWESKKLSYYRYLITLFGIQTWKIDFVIKNRSR